MTEWFTDEDEDLPSEAFDLHLHLWEISETSFTNISYSKQILFGSVVLITPEQLQKRVGALFSGDGDGLLMHFQSHFIEYSIVLELLNRLISVNFTNRPKNIKGSRYLLFIYVHRRVCSYG